MTLIKTFTYSIILSLTVAAYAEAKARSFGGGFRSQRAPADAPPPAQKTQPLNMSKDLNGNPTQTNSFKTADGKTNSTDQGAGSGWFRSGKPGNQTAQAAGAGQAAAQPTMRQGGGFMNNIMWFMLGSSLASHNRPAAAPADQAQAQQAAATTGDVTESGSVIAPPVAEKESFFMGLLRLVLWIAIIGGIFWGVRRVLQGGKTNAQKKSDYTFGNH